MPLAPARRRAVIMAAQAMLEPTEQPRPLRRRQGTRPGQTTRNRRALGAAKVPRPSLKRRHNQRPPAQRGNASRNVGRFLLFSRSAHRDRNNDGLDDEPEAKIIDVFIYKLRRSSLTPAAVRFTSRTFGDAATSCESQPSKRSQTDAARSVVVAVTLLRHANRHGTVTAAAAQDAHQPGEAVFRSILPEDIDWKPFAAFRLRSDWPCS